MPSYASGKELSFLSEFLDVVLAEVGGFCGGRVEGEDIRGGLEFGDEDEADGVAATVGRDRGDAGGH